MTNFCGRDFRLEVETSFEVWEPVPGEKSSSGKITNEQVDTTSKSDVASTAYRTLSACGTRSGELTASGVTADDSGKSLFNFLMARAMDGAAFNARSRSGSGVWYTTAVIVASMERTGEYNGAELYSLTLASAGTIIIDAFVFSVKTDNAGVSASNQFTLPFVASGSYSCLVQWGDGTSSHITAWNVGTTHTYSVAGTYEIQITGLCSGWSFDGGGDAPKFLTLRHWGEINFGDEEGALEGCVNLTIPVCDDVPNLSAMTSLGSFFSGCTSLTTIPLSAQWDTSTITMLRHLFNGCTLANPDLSGWDVSNVTNMFRTFRQSGFNNNSICNWDVSSCTSFGSTFSGNTVFNQDLSAWDTSAAVNFQQMFFGCTAFNQDLSAWDTSSVTQTDNMFNGCTAFKKADKLANWDITKVTTMSGMFNGVDINDPNSTANQTNYNTVLIGWAAQTTLNNVPLNAGSSSKYTIATAGAARTTLIGRGWTITDGGGV